MSSVDLRILLVEDDEDDYIITRTLITHFEHSQSALDWADSYETGLVAMQRCEHDVYLIDYRLGEHDGLDLLHAARDFGCNAPIIFLTGQSQSEVDIAATKAGASDYLLKSQIDAQQLERSIRYAVAQARTAQALREAAHQNSLLAAAIHHSTSGVLMTDPNVPDNPIIFANPAFTAITGYSEAEAIGHNCRFLQCPNTDPGVLRELRTAVTQQQPFRGLLLNQRKDGTMFWNGLTISPVLDDENKLINYIGLINDVTDRVEAEAELQRSEQRFRALIENSSDYISLLDENNLFLYNSPTITRILGYYPEELEGLNPLDFLHPDDRPPAEKVVAAVQSAPGQTIRVQFRMRHKNGSWVWLESVSANLLHDPSVQAIVVNLRDVSERKQAEEQLAASREQLRALAANLTTVREEERADIAREVHDVLGQALTGLKMDLGWLSRRIFGQRTPELLDAITDAEVDTLRQKIESMSASIDDTINSVQRISSQLRPSLLDDLGLDAAVEWQVQEFQERTDIRCECVSTVEDLELPPEQATAIFRVLQESLTNIARHAGATSVSVILEEHKGDLRLEVQDNGRGIAATELSDIKSLGLLGMQERALRVGGDVKIVGVAGKGTTVRVRIPLHNASTDGEEKP